MGKESEKNQFQYDLVQSLRTAYGNFVRSSECASRCNLSTVDHRGKYECITQDECGSYWFHKFNAGMNFQMGKISAPNVAISNKLFLNKCM